MARPGGTREQHAKHVINWSLGLLLDSQDCNRFEEGAGGLRKVGGGGAWSRRLLP